MPEPIPLDRPLRSLVVVDDDESDLELERRRSARLADLATAVSAAPTQQDVSRALTEIGARMPGVDTCVVAVGPAPRLRVVDTLNYSEAQVQRYNDEVPAPHSPLREAVASGRPVWVESAQDFATRFPDCAPLLAEAEPNAVWAAVPVRAGGKILGALGWRLRRAHYLDEAGRCFLLVVADLFGQAHERARLLEVEQERVQTEVRLVGVVGHQLRDPLDAMVAGAARLLACEALPDADRLVARQVRSSAQRVARLVDDLLEQARARLGGGLAMDLQPCDLEQVMRAVVEERRLGSPGQQIDLATDGPIMACADPERLSQVLSNLVGNALTHGDPARPVTVKLARAGARGARITTHNWGEPIRADVMPEIFDPFVHGAPDRVAERPAQRSRPGLGLGLFIARHIVERHGGTLSVSSDAGSGTTFTVQLPLTDAP